MEFKRVVHKGMVTLNNITYSCPDLALHEGATVHVEDFGVPGGCEVEITFLNGTKTNAEHIRMNPFSARKKGSVEIAMRRHKAHA